MVAFSWVWAPYRLGCQERDALENAKPPCSDRGLFDQAIQPRRRQWTAT